ncbi:uncharacterized protein VTP21DRAFT_9064 [Calcarisporiella thermophila]|uniref:uncharacterized protein n=1 Tax=Calcarisporiella thermophila TaxID=911321 RepID=UPI0037424DCA
MPPTLPTSGRAREIQSSTRVLRSDSVNTAESSGSRPADSTSSPTTATLALASSQEETTVHLLLKQQSEILKQLSEAQQRQSSAMEQMLNMFGRILEKPQVPTQVISPEYASPSPIEKMHDDDLLAIRHNHSFGTDNSDRPRRLDINDIPIFQGTISEDVDLWIERVSQMKSCSRTSDYEVILMLPNILKEEALDWFFDLGEEQRCALTTWDEWCAALRDYFRPPDYEAQLALKLRHRIFDGKESILNYYRNKYSLARRVYGENSHKVMICVTGFEW